MKRRCTARLTAVLLAWSIAFVGATAAPAAAAETPSDEFAKGLGACDYDNRGAITDTAAARIYEALKANDLSQLRDFPLKDLLRPEFIDCVKNTAMGIAGNTAQACHEKPLLLGRLDCYRGVIRSGASKAAEFLLTVDIARGYVQAAAGQADAVKALEADLKFYQSKTPAQIAADKVVLADAQAKLHRFSEIRDNEFNAIFRVKNPKSWQEMEDMKAESREFWDSLERTTDHLADFSENVDIGRVDNALKGMNSSMEEIIAGQHQMTDALNGVGGALDAMSKGVDSINGALGTMNEGTADLNSGLAMTNEGINAANKALADMNAGIDKSNGAVKKINDSVRELGKALDAFNKPNVPTAFDFSNLGDLFGSRQSILEDKATQLKMGALLDLSPVIGDAKGILEALTGKDSSTGDKLSPAERLVGSVVLLRWMKAGKEVIKAEELTEAMKAEKATGKIDGWMSREAYRKVPDSLKEYESFNRKGIGYRWNDGKGNGIRIDKGEASNPQPYQQVDHVVINSGGKIIGRNGQPINGSIKDDPREAHIPLDEWVKWKEWNQP